MATKRTTRIFGNRRITNTNSVKNGKTTTTRSESSARRTEPGQTRVTTTYRNGKEDTISTTNLGGGWFERKSSNGERRRDEAQTKANQRAWAALFGEKKKGNRRLESSAKSLLTLAFLIFVIAIYGIALIYHR